MTEHKYILKPGDRAEIHTGDDVHRFVVPELPAPAPPPSNGLELMLPTKTITVGPGDTLSDAKIVSSANPIIALRGGTLSNVLIEGSAEDQTALRALAPIASARLVDVEISRVDHAMVLDHHPFSRLHSSLSLERCQFRALSTCMYVAAGVFHAARCLFRTGPQLESHCCRFPLLRHSSFTDCEFIGAGLNKHVVKLHSANLGRWPNTDDVLFTRCRFVSDKDAWAVQVAPQSSEVAELLGTVTFVDAVHVVGPHSRVFIMTKNASLRPYTLSYEGNPGTHYQTLLEK